MKKTKIQKGITLIALIITIVILLILAVVTIGAIKDGGIVQHAKNAGDAYTIGQEKELIQLAYSNYRIKKYIPIERTEDQDELEKYFVGKIFTELVEDLDANPLVIKYSDTEEIIISLPDNIVVGDGENVYIHFKYNGYNYILTADKQTAYIKALELDKDNIIIKLEVVGAEVIGNEREGWGITFNNTNNKYTLNSDGTTWSKAYTSLEEITEEYSVIAKLYKTGETLTFPNGETTEEYHMTIKGDGEMAPLLTGGDISTGVAWLKDLDFRNVSSKWFGVTKLTIGEGITNIPDGAFLFGIWLNDVTLPSTLTSIGKEAFEGCVQLTEITIPDSVESIGNKCFYGCEKLTTIHYNGVATGRPWSAGTSISF